MEQIENLITKLIELTGEKKLSWDFTFRFGNGRNDDTNPLNSFEFRNEWTNLFESKSYFCKVNNLGTIFLIFQKETSGMDGAITEGYKLYLQTQPKGKLSQLYTTQENLYHLAEVVAYYRKKEDEDDKNVSDIITNFLENSSQN